MTLAALALARLWLLRRTERARGVAATGARRRAAGAPARRRRAGPSGGLGWAARRSSCCCRTRRCVLVSFVPAVTWTTEPFPPVLDLRNYAALFAEPERLRPIVNSLWMAAAATAAALGLGFVAAAPAIARRGRGGDRGTALERSRGRPLPWAVPGTVFAWRSRPRSASPAWLGRFVLVGTP